MSKFRNKMECFMRDRYGTDHLNNAMLVLCFILMIVGFFIRTAIINALIWIILIFVIFRTISRNGYKRRLENEKFLRIWNRIKTKYSLTIRRIKEIKSHRFRKCPYCKVVLRLPRRVGNHAVVCPRYDKEFNIRILV